MTISRWHSSTPRDRSCDRVTPLAPRPHGHEHARKRMQRARSKRPMHAGVVAPRDRVVEMVRSWPESVAGCVCEMTINAGSEHERDCGKPATKRTGGSVNICDGCFADYDASHIEDADGIFDIATRRPCAPQAAPAPATPAPRFKVGEMVRCVCDKAPGEFTVGNVYTVLRRDERESNRFWTIDDAGTENAWADKCFEPLAPAKPEACSECGAASCANVDGVKPCHAERAKPEAVLRWSGGEEVRIGDVVSRVDSEGEEYERTVTALHERYDGTPEPGAVAFDAGWNGRTSPYRLVRRAPAAAGAEVQLPRGWHQTHGGPVREYHHASGVRVWGPFKAKGGGEVWSAARSADAARHGTAPTMLQGMCAALSIRIEPCAGTDDGLAGRFAAWLGDECLVAGLHDAESCARAALEAHHGRAREVGR